ncbi:tRNA-(MS[2]IO[6]A)-hydroxylase (MiaE)-like [Propionibacterium cyclohexanicum]|uniref:tRNA-(MS[2]IO[6]A)-hydroxylase (MiaE)-like n=2 Tax=Propionibacterium cyclohexanicum TaxID=64702 RepID=A0A1H9RB05_9ACTN|nr:tRNA-(MS[2]IO[6]A)-hydroxylase (MiaE)-like [Propionibacterium cyclohexanicum]
MPGGGRDLLGFTAQADLVDFEMLAASGGLAPSLDDRLTVAGLAAAQFDRFERISEELRVEGAAVDATLEPFREAFDSFAQATRPSSWVVSQLRALLVTGLRTDFSARLAPKLSEPLAQLLAPGPAAWRTTDFASRAVQKAISARPEIGGSLALFGRRLAAEAVGQCQRIAAKQADLTALVADVLKPAGAKGSRELDDLGVISGLLEELMDGHARRMARLGLGV